MLDPKVVAESFSSDCKVTVPSPEANLHDVISRWSDNDVSMPALVVVPSKEEDVISAIRFATLNKLKLIPGSGGHAPFLPITSDTVYLDMTKFNKIEVDESNKTVTIGGGVVTRDLIKACSDLGCYTLWPNSNAVGMVGAFLGGGSNPFNGTHGFAIDHAVEVRIITGAGKALVVNHKSTGEEKKLFNALRGGGNGLGVVTSLTLRTFSTKALNMDNDQIWIRRLIFPAPAIETAAKLFTSLLPPPKGMTAVSGFLRAPPQSPKPGAPMIMVSCQYAGPATEAEKLVPQLFESEYVDKAIIAETTGTSMANMNVGVEPLNRHGGIKEFYSHMGKSLSESAYIQCFHRWIQFNQGDDINLNSYTVIGAWNTETLVENGKLPENEGTFFRWRDRGIFFQATPSFNLPETKEKAKACGEDLLKIVRAEDPTPTCFVNNMRSGMDLEENWSKDMLAELTRVKQVWDEHNIFWSPYSG